MVIIGISIAFSLNNWNELRKEEALEKRYLESFVSDLRLDAENLGNAIDTCQYFLKQNRSLTTAIVRGDYENDSMFFYVVSLYALTQFTPQNNTYETLKSSGRLELINNFALSRRITTYYNQHYRSIRLLDELIMDNRTNQIIPYIARNVRFTGRPIIQDKAFLRDNLFVNLAFTSRNLLNSQVTVYAEAKAEADSLLVLIDNYLTEID